MSPSELEIKDGDLKEFLDALKARSNYDFTDYSLKSLKRRITKILTESKFSISELQKEILHNDLYLEKVVKSITVNTTELFRDPSIWISLRNDILPKFAAQKTINIWHAGCSTGQEIYSMMMLLEELNMLSKSKIYASDINSDVLLTAQTGIYKYRFNHAYLDNFETVINSGEYSSPAGKKVSYEKYFTIDKVGDYIIMNPFLTEKPVYKKIDLVKDENLFFIKFDLIICRNVIIYFNYDLQNKVFNLFHQNMYNGGCLLLGLHESILGPYASHFDKKNHAYFKKESH